MNLSDFEMKAAERFARTAGELEKGHTGDEWGPTYNEVAIHVVSTIIMAASSLEAFINEVLLNASQFLPEHTAKIEAEWSDVERMEILAKFDWVASLVGETPIGTGGLVGQNADAVVAMRNALVHFKPQWETENKTHKNIENRIRQSPSKFKFSMTPLFAEAGIFPQRCMSHGCAMWCVKSALEYVERFCELTGVENRFSAKSKDFVA